jgi:hypothetical protein
MWDLSEPDRSVSTSRKYRPQGSDDQYQRDNDSPSDQAAGRYGLDPGLADRALTDLHAAFGTAASGGSVISLIPALIDASGQRRVRPEKRKCYYT